MAIKFCVKLEKSAAETIPMLKKAFGVDCLSDRQIFRWHKAFAEGREDVNDRAGRPSTSSSDDNVKRVGDLLNTDRRLSVRLISETLDITKYIVHEIMSESLGRLALAQLNAPIDTDPGLLDTVTLKGTRFESVEVVKAKATEVLNQLTDADFQHCFQQWKRRMERCFCLLQIQFRVLCFQLPVPFEGTLEDYLHNERDREINTFNRFHHKLMSYCQKYYNFTEIISITNSWGYKRSDNTFDGMVGDLERRVIDYGSSSLFARTDRAQVVDYGRRTWIMKAAFVFRNPKSGNSIEAFVTPLSSSVWIVIIFSIVIVMFALRISYLYERSVSKEQIEVSWSYMMICITAALSQQGVTKTPYFISGRIVMLFMFLLALLIYQFYSASLVSHLLMERPTKIKTVKDLLDSNLRVGCEDTLYNRDYFKYTTDKALRELYLKKMLDKKNQENFLQPQDGMALVKKGGYAFHVELVMGYPLIRSTFDDKEICELREVQMYRTQAMHSTVQKNSPYRDMFDTWKILGKNNQSNFLSSADGISLVGKGQYAFHLDIDSAYPLIRKTFGDMCELRELQLYRNTEILQRLAELGILTRELQFWHPPKSECIHSSKTTLAAIGLENFYAALMILAAGILLSLIVLIIESFIHFKNLCHKKKDDIGVIRPFVQ
ncbi:hypothetical protein NQ318_022583 [Aromia moschata]|uniref:Ionotropic glutamate receptor C-terminal domain-containing protein n=1 Tax=Aromia moschata TaxID=1265417 RepID=A0AAV8XV94_9CUCU|nr:hypothetical protein NQ318_022583 [Aromia moschata]